MVRTTNKPPMTTNTTNAAWTTTTRSAAACGNSCAFTAKKRGKSRRETPVFANEPLLEVEAPIGASSSRATGTTTVGQRFENSHLKGIFGDAGRTA